MFVSTAHVQFQQRYMSQVLAAQLTHLTLDRTFGMVQSFVILKGSHVFKHPPTLRTLLRVRGGAMSVFYMHMQTVLRGERVAAHSAREAATLLTVHVDLDVAVQVVTVLEGRAAQVTREAGRGFNIKEITFIRIAGFFFLNLFSYFQLSCYIELV